MADNGIGDFFISDVEDDVFDDDEDIIPAPAVVRPAAPVAPPPASQQQPPVIQDASSEAPTPPAAPQTAAPALAAVQAAPPVAHAGARVATREERLVDALNTLMVDSPDIQAAALVSMDGFTMASALPQGMQEDRVGAMSAAILGLGERAAAELGRGHLTQVFIEGADGYVMLVAAGDRGVLTVLAPKDAKLGLVLYDMKAAAEVIAGILG